jgi:hypothetical protein
MNILPILKPSRMIVVCTPSAAREQIAALTAELALCGAVTILDGGNRLPAYRIVRLLRMRTVNVALLAKQIFVRRAFTCYQMLALLESTPALHQPHIILDLLASFYDENVSTEEVNRLLNRCLVQLDRLKQEAPLLVSLGPPHPERQFLFERVCSRGDQTIDIEIPYPVITQPALF